MADLQGLLPPIPTPFEGEERVSPGKLEANISRWNEEPLDGYVILGSNGEAPLLDDEERGQVIRAARRAIPQGKRLMIVGTGHESTRKAIRATKEAFDLGADAVLVGAPSYYKPELTDEVLGRHYRRVADASTGPVLLYSVPQFTGVPLSPELVAGLASHPRVAGIKDSGGDPDNLRRLIETGKASGSPFRVLVGSARILAEAILAGASGGVLAVANVAPALCAEILGAARRGDAAAARAANERLAPLASAVTQVHGIGGLKSALDLLGYSGGAPRAPLPPASDRTREEIATLLREAGLLS
jgi:4-hydroxy-2-oxoglutarate aldolase